jgi:DNA-damage-inducible protein J
MDSDLKRQFEDFFCDNPNSETQAALQEVQRMRADPSLGQSYTDVDEMMRGLLS